MLFLELWQTTWSIIRSIQLKELGNNILHTQFLNFAKIRALCFVCIDILFVFWQDSKEPIDIWNNLRKDFSLRLERISLTSCRVLEETVDIEISIIIRSKN